jgi:PAS domain S-box-containing protein
MELSNAFISVILQLHLLLVHAGIAITIAALLFTVYWFQYKKLCRTYSRHNLSSVLKEKELLQQFFDNMPDRIYFKDRQSRFVLANKFVSAIHGHEDPRNLIGKTDFDFYDKEMAQPFFDDEQRIMKEGKPMINKEERGLDMNGNEIIVSTTKIPIRDNSNQIIGIIGLGRDISSQKNTERALQENTEKLMEVNALLEERHEEIEQISEELRMQAEHLENVNRELEKLSLVASKTSNVVLITDATGEIEWVNEGFREKYEMELEAFKALYGSNLRKISSYHAIDEALDSITQNRKSIVYVSEFTDKNGVKTWSQTNLTPIFDQDDEITNLVLIDSDITVLKNAEAQIREQNAEITAKSDELSRLIAARNKLLSIIGHDLKNPLNSIIGFSDLLVREEASLDKDKVKQYIEIIFNSSLSAQQLLDNLLNWARTQTGKINVEPTVVNLRDLVENVLPLQMGAASAKNVQLINKIDEKVNLFADRNMISTIIRNLASNAIKYSMEGGQVLFSGKAAGDEVIFKITDRGVGMDQETVQHLFKLDKMKSKPGTAGEDGTGLGLIICKEFVEKNDGKIEVTSKPGKGSTFTIYLPSKTL